MFAAGGNTSEKFTAEHHFAVMQDGSIYVLDIYESNEYIPYTPLYFSDPPNDVDMSENESGNVWIDFMQEYIGDNIA